MKYMLLISFDESWGKLTVAERQEAYWGQTKVADELTARGKYLGGNPLHPPTTATTIRVRDGKRLLTDGPFAETREHVGGYMLIDVENLDEAIAVAARSPVARVGSIEVRPVREGPPEREIVITRVLDAPRERVFRVWTEPEHVKHWWGPEGFTAPACTIDLRPGGAFHLCMRAPDGADYWSKGVYREIVVPSLILSTDFFSDAEGNRVEPTRYGMSPDWPAEALLMVTFAEHGGKTTLTLRHTVGAAPDREREMCQEGWMQTLDRLAAYLADPGGRV
jgi:uncharacterized protein YndB with AHSA1/START domain